MAIYDSYNLRYNTTLASLEMNTGGEDWTLVPGTGSSVVDSINTLTGPVVFAAGTNITLTPVGNTITVDATGGGSPGGADTAVQFNNAGAFGGDANVLAYSGGALTIGNAISLLVSGGSFLILDDVGTFPIVLNSGVSSYLSVFPNGGVGIKSSGQPTTPNGNTALDLQDINFGLGLNRVDTTARDAMVSPQAGTLIYNSTTNKLNFYNGTTWQVVTSA